MHSLPPYQQRQSTEELTRQTLTENKFNELNFLVNRQLLTVKKTATAALNIQHQMWVIATLSTSGGAFQC